MIHLYARRNLTTAILSYRQVKDMHSIYKNIDNNTTTFLSVAEKAEKIVFILDMQFYAIYYRHLALAYKQHDLFYRSIGSISIG